MPQSTAGLHHRQRRKRIHQKHEEWPHPDRFKRWMDRLIYAMGVAVPVFTIPQALEIWVNRSAVGVSYITWVVYLVNSIIWTVYGIAHREKPIVFTFAFIAVLNIVIVSGIILFG